MDNKQSESVKTLELNSGYSLLRIVIDPRKDPRGPKMLFTSGLNSFLEKRDTKKPTCQ